MSKDHMEWMKAHPDVAAIYAGACDLNGGLRGKRLPVDQLGKLLDDKLRMPFSLCNVDIWGDDIVGSRYVFETGDADGVAAFTGRPLVETSWSERKSAMALLWMAFEDGSPFPGDPRRALAAICDRYKAAGLTPVVAAEFEFYLFDPKNPTPCPPSSPVTSKPLAVTNVISVNEVQAFDAFLGELYDCCEAQGIPADAAISEGGTGQFEINMKHIADPLRAADDGILFKQIVRGIARKHGFAATFMAKPYGEDAGSGLHYHLSILDQDGNNIFDDGSMEGSAALKHAVGGLLETMHENMLVFAPHANSYRRFQPDSHSPSSIGWGYENRTAAIRIPGGPGGSRRIEHRVAGVDANPYLVLSAILGGVLLGIQNETAPSAPFSGSAYDANLPTLPTDWAAAIAAFETGEHIEDLFSPTLKNMLLDCKRQEMRIFSRTVTDFEYNSYLEVV